MTEELPHAHVVFRRVENGDVSYDDKIHDPDSEGSARFVDYAHQLMGRPNGAWFVTVTFDTGIRAEHLFTSERITKIRNVTRD